MTQEGRQVGLQALLRAALLEHRRHQGPAVARAQGRRMGRRQLRGGGEVEVVVGVEADGARSGVAAAKEMSTAPVLSDPAEVHDLHAAAYELR
jgi:GTPase